MLNFVLFFFFFSSRRRHTRWNCDWSSDVCSSDLVLAGARLGRRVTLIDPEGHVRGDTEFDRASLARLENHRNRPEVRAVLDSAQRVGMNERLSASTNEPQMYIAIKDGPPGLAVVRVSTTLIVVDAQVHAVQRAV